MKPEALLRSRKTEDRLRALRLMANNPDLLHPHLVQEHITDRSPLVAQRAIGLVADCGHKAAVPVMKAHYGWLQQQPVARDPGCTVRQAIVKALDALDSNGSGDIFLQALHTTQMEAVAGGMEDTAVGLRTLGALALGNTGHSRYITDLAIALQRMPAHGVGMPDANVRVRPAAANACGALGDPRAEAVLVPKIVLANDDPEVLVACMDALVAVRSERALEFIVPMLKHTEPYIVAGAATACAATGRAEVAPILARAAHQAVAPAREAVVLSLAALRRHEAVPHLVALEQSPELDVARAAAQALQSFSPEAVVRARAAKL